MEAYYFFMHYNTTLIIIILYSEFPLYSDWDTIRRPSSWAETPTQF